MILAFNTAGFIAMPMPPPSLQTRHSPGDLKLQTMVKR